MKSKSASGLRRAGGTTCRPVLSRFPRARVMWLSLVLGCAFCPTASYAGPFELEITSVTLSPSSANPTPFFGFSPIDFGLRFDVKNVGAVEIGIDDFNINIIEDDDGFFTGADDFLGNFQGLVRDKRIFPPGAGPVQLPPGGTGVLVLFPFTVGALPLNLANEGILEGSLEFFATGELSYFQKDEFGEPTPGSFTTHFEMTQRTPPFETPIPEPSTILLVGSGAIGLGLRARRGRLGLDELTALGVGFVSLGEGNRHQHPRRPSPIARPGCDRGVRAREDCGSISLAAGSLLARRLEVVPSGLARVQQSRCKRLTFAPHLRFDGEAILSVQN